MLVCCCQGNKRHSGCKRAPHVVASAFEVLHVCEASEKENNDISLCLLEAADGTGEVYSDLQKHERAAPF